jgi:peroxiredoxin
MRPTASIALGLVLTLLIPAAASATATRAGEKAPAFNLKTVDKGELRTLEGLSKAKGTAGTVVVFLSARCPYVVQARARLAELHKQYGARLQFVGVNSNQNESLDEVKADAALNFPFPMLRDEGSKVADLYGAERTPEIFVVDPSGIVRYHGGVADLGAALGEVTARKPVSKAEAKAFGCTIKRKP